MTESKNHARLLIVEDESHLSAGLKLNFELDGFTVDVAATGREASTLLIDHDHDVIILDVMLPDTDGFTLCKQLRDAGNFAPVIMLTARDSAEDRVLTLMREAGLGNPEELGHRAMLFGSVTHYGASA